MLHKTFEWNGQTLSVECVDNLQRVFGRITDIIFQIIKDSKYSKPFRFLDVQLVDRSMDWSRHFGYVDPEEAMTGMYRIYLHSSNIIADVSKNRGGLKQALENVITHEIRHLWQIKKSKAVRAGFTASKRLHRLLTEMNEIDNKIIRVHELQQLALIIRQRLQYFFYNLQVEGSVHYADIYPNIEMNDGYYKKIYHQCATQAREAYNTFNEIIVSLQNLSRDSRKNIADWLMGLDDLDEITEVKKKFAGNAKLEDELIKAFAKMITTSTLKDFNSLKEIPYNIGGHMTLTILRYKPQEFDEDSILLMSPFKFISEYEDACHKHGIDPIVTTTSGKGILDYNQLIQKWSAIAQNIPA